MDDWDQFKSEAIFGPKFATWDIWSNSVTGSIYLNPGQQVKILWGTINFVVAHAPASPSIAKIRYIA